MGAAKRQMEEDMERGWTLAPENAYVCAACVDDKGLIAAIEEEASEHFCSYCDNSADDPISIPVNRLFEILAAGIRYEWTDPVNELPVEGGAYVFEESIVDSDDLLATGELGLVADGLIEQFLESFSWMQWVQRDFFALPYDEALMVGWEAFKEEVVREVERPDEARHETFGSDIAPEDLLDHLGSAVNRSNAIRYIPTGTRLYRARVHRVGATVRGAAELGAPPADRATMPNRISPAGESMFYGSFDEETAVLETLIPEPGKTVTIGSFTLNEEIAVLDLTELPEIPSLFSEERYARRPLMFLKDFSADVSKPIARDGREHVEYVPTQRVTAYFRDQYEPLEAPPLRGLVYRSSRNGEPCIVLFAGNDDAIDLAHRGPEDSHLLTLESQTTR